MNLQSSVLPLPCQLSTAAPADFKGAPVCAPQSGVWALAPLCSSWLLFLPWACLQPQNRWSNSRLPRISASFCRSLSQALGIKFASLKIFVYPGPPIFWRARIKVNWDQLWFWFWRVWRKGLAVKSTSYCCRGPKFGSPHLSVLLGSQPTVTPTLGQLIPSSGFCGHRYIHAHMPMQTHIYTHI